MKNSRGWEFFLYAKGHAQRKPIANPTVADCAPQTPPKGDLCTNRGEKETAPLQPPKKRIASTLFSVGIAKGSRRLPFADYQSRAKEIGEGLGGEFSPMRNLVQRSPSGGVCGAQSDEVGFALGTRCASTAFEMVLRPRMEICRRQINLSNNNLHAQHPIGGCASHSGQSTPTLGAGTAR